MSDYILKTAISQIEPDRILVRGHSVVDLAANCSFGETLYLLLRGELPAGQEGRLIEAMLVIMSEHSINAPSTHAARTVASCGTPLQTAMAAGISAIGEHHGGAGEACARILQEGLAGVTDPTAERLAQVAAQIVAEARSRGERLPGFGHRFHDPDPRAVYMLHLAEELGIAGKHTALAQSLVTALQQGAGRSLPLNVDGALAALISDMGFDWRLGKGFFIIARTAGLLAHVHEEMTTGKPLQFAPKATIDYIGPPPCHTASLTDGVAVNKL
jgi:citrate synthase